MTEAIQTTGYWDTAVDGYVAVAEPFTAQFCADAARLAGIAPGMRLLDVAAGPGALSLAAAALGAQVTAIDFSAAMVGRLRERARGLPIEARQMDGQALDLPDASFDRACSVFGVPLFPDWRAGLRELARVLQPGGVGVVATAANPYGFGPNTLIAEARAALFPGRDIRIGVEGMAQLADRDRLAAEMAAAGFAAPVIHVVSHDFELDPATFEDRGMLAANPLLSGLSDDERARVVAAARSRAEAHRVERSGRVPGVAFIAVAERP